MPADHQPRFRIVRIDTPEGGEGPSPDTAYRAFWKIEGTTYRVRVWSHAEWARRPPTDPPPEAQSLDGKGWMQLQPIDAR